MPDQDEHPRQVTLSLAWDDDPPNISVSFIVTRKTTPESFRHQLALACKEIQTTSDEQIDDFIQDL